MQIRIQPGTPGRRFRASRPRRRAAFFCLLLPIALAGTARPQSVESNLEKLMVKYEEKVLSTYQEMQALDHVAVAAVERAAFDSVLSAYTSRVLEIYETLNRVKGFTLENYRNIAGRVLIFRALAYLETSATNPTNLERACADYRRALRLTRNSKIPVINQTLPYEVWVDRRLYTRLADLLDDKDQNFTLLRCMSGTNEKERIRDEDH